MLHYFSTLILVKFSINFTMFILTFVFRSITSIIRNVVKIINLFKVYVLTYGGVTLPKYFSNMVIPYRLWHRWIAVNSRENCFCLYTVTQSRWFISSDINVSFWDAIPHETFCIRSSCLGDNNLWGLSRSGGSQENWWGRLKITNT